MPEGDETQLEEEPAPAASDETQLEPAPPLATLTQLEPVAEEEEPDGTEIEENDETQLEAPPPPPPNDDDDELRFEEADDDDDNSEAAPDAETQLDAEPQPEALPPPVAPEHASPSVLDGAARIAQAQAPDLASPAPRRRGSQSNEGPPSAPGKGAARELFSFEDDQGEAPAPAPADDEGPIADDRTADGVFAESEGEEEEVVEEAPAEELRVGGGAVDKETGQAFHVIGKTKGWWTVQAPGAAKPLSRRASSLTPCAPPPEDDDEDAADANAETQLGGDAPADDAETQLDAPPPWPEHSTSAEFDGHDFSSHAGPR